jgi:hypothetical protein
MKKNPKRLRVEAVEVNLEISDRVLPELANGEHLGFTGLRAHSLDKVRDKIAIDVLYRDDWECLMPEHKITYLDSTEAETSRSQFFCYPLSPVYEVRAHVGMVVIDIRSNWRLTSTYR